MTVQQTVDLRDLHRLLAITDRTRTREPGEPFPPSVFRDLADLIPCDDVVYLAYDPHTHLDSEVQGLPDANPDPVADDDARDADSVFWSNFWRWPASYPERSGDRSTVFRDEDFPMSRQNAGVKADWLRMVAARHSVIVPLRPRGSITRRLVLWRRDGPGFTDREVTLLSLARPHLVELHDELNRERFEAITLTARQQELMQLVGGGQSNRQIARHLGVSEGTVRKHLENIYAKLGVTNRVAALSVLHPPAPTPGAEITDR